MTDVIAHDDGSPVSSPESYDFYRVTSMNDDGEVVVTEHDADPDYTPPSKGDVTEFTKEVVHTSQVTRVEHITSAV